MLPSSTPGRCLTRVGAPRKPWRTTARVSRAQANALQIEAAARRRLADEFDAAKARREVAEAIRPAEIALVDPGAPHPRAVLTTSTVLVIKTGTLVVAREGRQCTVSNGNGAVTAPPGLQQRR